MPVQPDLDALASAVETAIEEALITDRTLRDHLVSLSVAASLEPSGFEPIPELRERRTLACRGLGAAVLAWVRAGGSVVLEDQVSDQDAPATAEVDGADPIEPASEPPTSPPAEDGPVSPSHGPEAWQDGTRAACCTAGGREEVTLSESLLEGQVAPQTLGPEPTTAAAAVADSVAPTVDDQAVELNDEEPTDEVPTSRPASLAALDALKARFQQGGGFADTTPVVVQTSLPPTILQRLGPPRRVTSASEWSEEVRLLATEVRTRSGWSDATRSAHHELVSYVVARARYLQDEALAGASPRAQRHLLTGVFRSLSAYQANARKGFVVGLAREQRPPSGSWWAGARLWWRKLSARTGFAAAPSQAELLADVSAALAVPSDTEAVRVALEAAIAGGVASDNPRLVALIEPFAHLLDGTTRLKTLRSVLKQRSRETPLQVASTAPDGAVTVPEAVVSWTRGKSAVLVGGDRIRVRGSLEQTVGALELADVQWETGKQVRRVASVAERVRTGGVDLVVLFRQFISHTVSEQLLPACKGMSGVTVVWVDSGYGAASVLRALEGCVERVRASA